MLSVILLSALFGWVFFKGSIELLVSPGGRFIAACFIVPGLFAWAYTTIFN